MELARFDRAHVEKCIHGAPEFSDRAEHGGDGLFLSGVQRSEIAALEQPEIADDGCERGGELMRDVPQEISSKARHLLEPCVGGAELSHFFFETLDDALTLLAEARLGGID